MADDSRSCSVVVFLARRVQAGGDRYLAEVALQLARRGVKVVRMHLDDYPPWARRMGLPVDCVVNGLWLFWRAVGMRHVDWSRAILFQDAYSRPRVVLLNLLVRVWTGRLRTVVLVQSAFANHRLLRNPVLRFLDRLILRALFQQACLVLTNSEFTRKEVLALGIAPDSARVVHCGYDGLDTEPRQGPVDRACRNGAWRILFVGRCEPNKGLDLLVKAMVLMRGTAASDAYLDVVGDTCASPKYYWRVLNAVREAGLEEHVRFLGHVGDRAELRKLYEQADLFVLPSRSEGFGIVLLEAMAFGLPVVATRVGAIPELVQDGVNGVLVAPEDADGLAAAIAKVLRHPELRAKYSRNAHRFACERREFYSWQAVGDRIIGHLRVLDTITS